VTQGPRPLLAKSVRGGLPPVTLEEHLRDTERAAARIFRADGRWGRAWARFFRIDEPRLPELDKLLRVAALFHDIGKANEAFQARVQGGGPVETLRHEHLSALILCLPEVRQWLEQAGIDVDIVTAAVLSHHLKASDANEWAWAQPRNASFLELRLDDAQVEAILDRVALVLGTDAAPRFSQRRWSASPPWTDAFETGMRAARQFGRDLRGQSERRALLLATKAGLIVADAVASGIVRVGRSIDEWIDVVVHTERLSAERLESAIVRPRLAAIGKAAGLQGPAELHAFQAGVAGSGSRVLLLAACGAGKTLAAWKWAEAQARTRDVGRVIFLYPTRGTATEGFRDYVSWAPETDGALVHGTSTYELDGMRGNPPDGAQGKDFSLREDDARLFALGLWSRRYFSATVDQFLSFLEHRYESLCLLPALADAAVVIDEIHSFDARMFDDLIAFLRHFDVPVLCMTATLPEGQRRQIADAGLRLYPSESQAGQLADLAAVERAPRYRLLPVATEQDALARAVDGYREGLRVLWVVNTVARAQRLADLLSATLGDEVLCYHSRFRLVDRQASHRRTVAAFQQRTSPAIAVTTQVCEMSLDLDGDVLLSEHAPVTSLVQRFGRANRKLARPGLLAKIHTYAPESLRPYDREDMASVDAFFGELAGRDVSQRDLAEALVRHAPRRRDSTGSARFLDGGYFAVPGDFRDSDDFSRMCVLDRDLDSVRAALRRREAVDGWVLPVPRRFATDLPETIPGLPRHIGLAAAERYSDTRGFVTASGAE